ncbi:hypothetical protein [Desmospora activa]|uniref:Uncharacterized protein n=1 Tax=Desmospora activa DSM 45169 TaxID=1121389 RepID=A0A2T4ZBL5_9BACL|nr:hypothetical protein [Desmospora activa]PTM59267.1 hypothetical protein C8J48_1872 [Desmospora activa DSM 45169]
MNQLKMVVRAFLNMKKPHQMAVVGMILLAIRQGLALVGITIPDETAAAITTFAGTVLTLLATWTTFRNSGADPKMPEEVEEVVGTIRRQEIEAIIRANLENRDRV